MKKIVYIIIALIVGCSHVFAQQQVVKYPGYVSYYNPDTLIPDSVIWVETAHSKVAGRATGFHSTGGRINQTKDYAHSGYDIGHNCDASDENGNATDEYNSFDFVNTFPQRPNCNRITWLALENRVRLLAAKYGPVKNKVYWLGISGHIGKDRVTVPTLCIKEIWYNGIHEKYVMPNSDTCNRHPYTFYRFNSQQNGSCK
jgi:DNA/RNA endonuclease G (NUC1)